MSTFVAAAAWPGRQSWMTLATVLSAVAGTAVAGILVAWGYVVPLLGLLVFGAVFAVGLRDWRWSLLGLLAYLPFSGIPVVLMYPATQVPVLLKDFLFVLPAYGGFALHYVSARSRIPLPGVPLAAAAGLGVWVVVQIFNPSVPSPLVGLIGLKVWLLYVPLFFLGYQLASSKEWVLRSLRLMACLAVIPAAIGIAQAVLVYSGYPDIAYAPYGPAAAAVTQNFAETDYKGGGVLRKVPSTFSFITQYYTFTAAMVAITYAWWQGDRSRLVSGAGRAAVWITVIIASFLTGARGAFIFTPLLMLMVVILDRRSLRALPALGGVFLALIMALSVLGADAGEVVGHAAGVGRGNLNQTFFAELEQALQRTWMGLGTGVNTNAARYAFDDFQSLLGRVWYESWVVKVVLELGLPGLLLFAVLFGWILVTGLGQHFRLNDPLLRTVSAALLGVLLWNVAYFPKAQYIDIDPMNVYFWLFAGILCRLPTLDTPGAPPRSPLAAAGAGQRGTLAGSHG